MSNGPLSGITVTLDRAGLASQGRVMLAFGAAQVVLGILLAVWPGVTLAVFAVLIGISILVAGIIRVVLAALDSGDELRVVHMVLGLVGTGIGLLVISAPLRSAAVLVAIIGAFWVLWGLVELFRAVVPGSSGMRAPLLVDAVLVGIAGIVLLAWPDSSLTALTVLTGLLTVVVGLAGAWAGWKLQSTATGP